MELKIIAPDDAQAIRALAAHLVDEPVKALEKYSLVVETPGGGRIQLDRKQSSEEVVEEFRAQVKRDMIEIQVHGEPDFHRIANAMLDLAEQSGKSVHLFFNALYLTIEPYAGMIDLENQFLDELGIDYERAKLHPDAPLWIETGACDGTIIDFAHTAIAAAGVVQRSVKFNFFGKTFEAQPGGSPEMIEAQYCSPKRKRRQ